MSEADQKAVSRFCATVRRGLGRLTPDGRQRLLRSLIEHVVIRAGELEIHGVLPGRELIQTRPDSNQYPVSRYSLTVPFNRYGGRLR